MGAAAGEERDRKMLARCIALSREAIEQGEDPFACVICENERVVAEATTRTRRDRDVSRHAEMLALSQAQTSLGTKNLRRCTIYSTVEPCAMCAFCIRATGIGRVVYAIASPIMGGCSRWNILGDGEISDVMPEVFHGPPEIVSGLMADEAEQVWRGWHPIDWAVLTHRHALEKPAVVQRIPGRNRFWSRLRSWLHLPASKT